jgi:hypothetical protein
MQVKMDRDVLATIQFMQSRIQANKLVGVATALSGLAPLIWTHNRQEPIDVMRVSEEPVSENG